jgi:hypothetical protein
VFCVADLSHQIIITPKQVGITIKRMRTQHNKTRTRIILGIVLILGICLSIPFCLGMYAGYTSHSDTTGAITKALKEECSCKTIDFDTAAYGLQFSTADGMTGNKAAYILKECEETATAKEETERFNKIFMNEIEGYTKIDVIDFQFIKGDSREVVTVKKGIVQ